MQLGGFSASLGAGRNEETRCGKTSFAISTTAGHVRREPGTTTPGCVSTKLAAFHAGISTVHIRVSLCQWERFYPSIPPTSDRRYTRCLRSSTPSTHGLQDSVSPRRLSSSFIIIFFSTLHAHDTRSLYAPLYFLFIFHVLIFNPLSLSLLILFFFVAILV